jgi:uncharacterized protein (DUF2141 family)
MLLHFTGQALLEVIMQFLPSLLIIVAVVFGQSPNGYAETLTVKMTGLHANAGSMYIALWKDASGFPTKPEKAAFRQVVPVAGTQMEVSFKGLAQGVYAVSAYQDLNSNGKLDRSIFGWPTEPLGASNGASGTVGPPKFSDAAFELKQPSQTIEFKLK